MRILFFLFLTINLMGQTPPRVTFKQIQKDTLTGSIAVSGLDSNLTYSRNFYISADSFLILYGDTVGQGSLNAILVDGVTILGDGVNTNLSADTNLIKDIIGAMVNAGLGIDVTYDNVNKELIIESLSIEDLVHNGTGTQIDKGTPLYVVGVQGNYWSVAPADAGDISKLPVVAIAGENIVNGTEGLALIKGHIKGVNTSAFTAGDEVYVAVGGGYTNVKPKGESNYVQYLGTVIKADANGSGIINLEEVESNLNPGRIFIGAADSTITRVSLKDSIIAVVGDSLNSNVVRSITAGTYLSGGTITTSGTIALDTASAGLKTYISENIGTVDLASQVTGTLPVANGGTGATTLTANKVLVGNGTNAVSSSTNLSETADTVFVAKFLNVDTATFYVNADSNRVAIGQTQTLSGAALSLRGGLHIVDPDTTNFADNVVYIYPKEQTTSGPNSSEFAMFMAGPGSSSVLDGPYFMMRGNNYVRNSNQKGLLAFFSGANIAENGRNGQLWFDGDNGIDFSTTIGESRMYINRTGNIFMSNLQSTLVGDYDLRIETSTGEIGYNTSSVRFKENINDYNKGLEYVLNLRPVTFNYITDTLDRQMVGFIAEQLDEIGLQEGVVYKEDGSVEGINSRIYNPILVNAIKEQQLIIQTQKQEIETLKTQYNDLLQRIINLENK